MVPLVNTASRGPTEAHGPPSLPDEAIYFGMQLWPIEPTSWRPADSPDFPTKQDLDHTYWFVEELHRAMVALGLSHAAAARYVRNWSKYIGQLQKPPAVTKLMQEMAQRIDMHGRYPERQSDLKKWPSASAMRPPPAMSATGRSISGNCRSRLRQQS